MCLQRIMGVVFIISDFYFDEYNSHDSLQALLRVLAIADLKTVSVPIFQLLLEI